MKEVVNNYIIDNLGFVALILIVVIYMFIYVAIKINKIYTELGKINNLPCDRHHDRIDRHEGEIIRINTSLEYLSKNLEDISRSLQKKSQLIIDDFTKSHSPIQITETGWEMINSLGLDKMFDKKWASIRKMITENVKGNNPYDIDNYCFEQAVVFPEKFLDKEDLEIVKTDAYKRGLTLTAYMKVVAVMARDRYFKEENIKIGN